MAAHRDIWLRVATHFESIVGASKLREQPDLGRHERLSLALLDVAPSHGSSGLLLYVCW